MFDAFEMTPLEDLTPKSLFENLKTGRYDAKWSKGTRLRKRAAIRKANKVFKRAGYSVSEEGMPTTRLELEYFAAGTLNTNELARQFGFKNAKAAAKWTKEYATVLDVASGFRDFAHAMRHQNDEAATLLDHLTGKFGGPVIYGTYEMISICSLIMRCRENRVGIPDLTPDVVKHMCADLPKAKVRAVRVALLRLQELQGTDYVPSELLPKIDAADLPTAKKDGTRIVPAIHPAFEKLMQRFIAQASEGTITMRYGAQTFGVRTRAIPTEKKGAARIKNINCSLRWLWHGLVVLGHACSHRPFEPSCLGNIDTLVDLLEACAAGKLGAVSSKQTRRDRVLAVIPFLDWLHPGFCAQLPMSFYKHGAIFQRYREDTKNRQMKRTACLNFVNDTRLQRQFFLMPKSFYDEASPIIDNFKLHFRADGNGLSRKQNRALELAVMAAWTAIVTLYPSRLATINQFKVAGVRPNVRFPDDARKENLVLDIPGYIVKNGRFASGIQLQPNGQVSPRQILRWYIEKALPLVLHYKHKHADRRQPELLFAGLHIDTLRRYWANHVPAIGLDMTPHMCRHFTASLLLHEGASMTDVAVLLGISEAVARNNYGFISSTTKVQNMMAVQASIYRRVAL